MSEAIKTCTKCKSEKALADFYRDKSRKDGHSSRCKECQRSEAAAHYAANPEKGRKRSAAWRIANPEMYHATRVAYYAANREKSKADSIAWATANPERKKASNAAWYAANADKVDEQNKAWIKENPEKARASRRARKIRRRCRECNAEGEFITGDIDFIRDCQSGLCAYCEVDLSQSGEHIDHVIPISLGGTNWPQNLQLTCPTCNLRKGAKHPVDFEKSMIEDGIVSWPANLNFTLEKAA